MKKAFLALTLTLSMVASGCSVPSWVGQVGTIVSALAPAVINVLNIISIAEGKPANTALAAKITTDAADLKAVATDFANASAASAPATCQQVQAAVGVLSKDFSDVLEIVNVDSSSSKSLALQLFGLADSAFLTVTALIPSCQNPVALKASLAKASPAISANQFIGQYNTALTQPTSNVSVNAYAKAHKIHAHNKFIRVLSFGMEK
jgi:hypothetical protein